MSERLAKFDSDSRIKALLAWMIQ